MRLVELQSGLRGEFLEEGWPNSVVRLAECLCPVPIVTAPRVEQLLAVTRPTAQAATDALVEKGELAEVTGRERNRIYEASRICDAVYGTAEAPVTVGRTQLDLGIATNPRKRKVDVGPLEKNRRVWNPTRLPIPGRCPPTVKDRLEVALGQQVVRQPVCVELNPMVILRPRNMAPAL